MHCDILFTHIYDFNTRSCTRCLVRARFRTSPMPLAADWSCEAAVGGPHVFEDGLEDCIFHFNTTAPITIAFYSDFSVGVSGKFVDWSPLVTVEVVNCVLYLFSDSHGLNPWALTIGGKLKLTGSAKVVIRGDLNVSKCLTILHVLGRKFLDIRNISVT